MANYGQAIGSVIGATMVFDAVGGITKKRKKLTMNKTKCKRKKR
jgi:hypothetical protein